MNKEQIHYWRGEWLDDGELEARIATFPREMEGVLNQTVDLEALLCACQRMSERLVKRDDLFDEFVALLRQSGSITEKDIFEGLVGISEFLRSSNLALKLERELGSKRPFTSARKNFFEAVYECWAPLGLLVHVAPTNAFTVGVLSVIEGLLSGNANVLKTSGKDSLFPQKFLASLAAHDPAGNLQNFIIAARIPSQRQGWLKQVFSQADGIAAWGGEESVAAVRSLAPEGARFVDWGPKISFAYVAASRLGCSETAHNIAYDICVADQQACSSPQCVYVESDSQQAVREFATNLAAAMAEVSPKMPGLAPELQEQAEITNVTELTRLGSCLQEGEVREAEDKTWRVLVEYKPGLRASPLFRTIWVKPLPRPKIVATLRPLRQYLQTSGLAGNPNEIAAISRQLIAAGVQRITPPGRMHDSYMGEPHDGRYALQAYTRRISWQLDESFDGISSLEDLTEPGPPPALTSGVMTKEDFQAQTVDDRFAHLYFKSGGSSGEPKLSVFTYDDYHGQMFAAAEGLFAAGLRPKTDRCINLFFGGGLYGGFISFFTILERLGAVQLPMASHIDYEFVVDMIKRNRVNTLLGMPSYINQLFRAQANQLHDYGGIEKVFYGGEHFNEVQRQHLIKDFGVKQVTSATYGSVDAGPLGFQCQHCEGAIHHLHNRLQHLEIVQLDRDHPAGPGEAGRLIFSSRMREGQAITRYEIGDLGRWVDDACKCGRTSPRFELLGRHGDVARVGTTFINYGKINHIIAEGFNYAGDVQLVLEYGKHAETIVIRVEPMADLEPSKVVEAVLEAYSDLREVVEDGLVTITATYVAPEQMERSAGSGKLRHIIDRRVRA